MKFSFLVKMNKYRKAKDVPSAYWLFAIDVVAYFNLKVHPSSLEDELDNVWQKYKLSYKTYQKQLKNEIRVNSEVDFTPGKFIKKMFENGCNEDEINAIVHRYTRTRRLYSRERPQAINSGWTDIDLWRDLSDNGF